MTVLLLCLMAYQVTGEALHEWMGIGMTVRDILYCGRCRTVFIHKEWNAGLSVFQSTLCLS